jgi:hypothetical protein
VTVDCTNPGVMALRLGLSLVLAAAAVARGGRTAPDEYYVDRTTVAYCNLPNTNSIPPLHDDVVERHPGLELLQVRFMQGLTLSLGPGLGALGSHPRLFITTRTSISPGMPTLLSAHVRRCRPSPGTARGRPTW